jgi:2-keto-myo-inositol isomerase
MKNQPQRCSRREAALRVGLTIGAALTATKLPLAPYAQAQSELKPQPAFRFCLNTGTVRGQKLGIVKEIEVAAKAGYQGIEPWVEAIQKYAEEGGSLPDLRRKIQDLGLAVESAISFPEWLVDDDSRRAKGLERAKRDMELVAQLGGKRLAAPPAGATDTPGLDLLKAADRYRALLELGDQSGVVPQLEMWGFSKNIFRVGQAALVAIETGHPKACVLADVFHMYKGGGAFTGLRQLSSQAIQVFHMNDYPAEPARDQVNDSYRVFPGDGIAPFNQILRDLHSTGPGKVLSLELFNRKYWEQDALDVAKAGLEKMKSAVNKALAN